MKRVAAALFIAGASLLPAYSGTDGFDNIKPEDLTRYWRLTQTGNGSANWAIVPEQTAPSLPAVLKQSGQADYPLALKRDVKLKNGHVEVKFKALYGKKDQAAGLVWRAHDESNYYICRANALEHNVVLYKTEGGKRKALDIVGRAGGYGVEAKVEQGKWHTLRIEFKDRLFRVVFNGKRLFDVTDDTFSAAGLVGLWTKADSETLFDEFSWVPAD